VLLLSQGTLRRLSLSDKPPKKKEPNSVERGIVKDRTEQQNKTNEREQ